MYKTPVEHLIFDSGDVPLPLWNKLSKKPNIAREELFDLIVTQGEQNLHS